MTLWLDGRMVVEVCPAEPLCILLVPKPAELPVTGMVPFEAGGMASFPPGFDPWG